MSVPTLSPPRGAPIVDAVMQAKEPTVVIPTYDRGALTPGVVHIGVGGFHRAHQAVYFDELARLGDTGWGVVGVGLRRPEMGQVLSDQYGLFSVVERGRDGDHVRVVGSMIQYLFAPDDPTAVVATLAAASTQLVTLTVTGSGYLVDSDGQFQADDDGVQHDLSQPGCPKTMVGFVTEGLRRRRESGLGPFTVLSCDNLPDSGAAARTAITSYARLLDPALAEWIDTNVSFPSSMVDRITPETSDQLREEVRDRFGLPDRWPVVTEPFKQWIVEDDFCGKRPPLERVGAQFVSDVTPYKIVKSRVLNGAHCALGYLGTLHGYSRTDEAMADPHIHETVVRMLRDEVRPLLPQAPGLDLDDYITTTVERLVNPAIGDSLDRLCRRGSVKMPAYLLPSLSTASQQKTPHSALVLAVAAWIRYLRGTDLAGARIEIDDPQAATLCDLAGRNADDPRELLSVRSVFGRMGDDPELVRAITSSLRALSGHEAGARQAAWQEDPAA
jgi:mannitol 2-dehydrogenase